MPSAPVVAGHQTTPDETHMEFLPVFLDVKNKPCLVVGGGKVALRKVSNLLGAGARVILVSPRLVEGLDRLRENTAVEYRPGEFDPGDLEGEIDDAGDVAKTE